jgi:hypothetical protein
MKTLIYLFSLLLVGVNNLHAQSNDTTIPPTSGNPNAKSVAVGNAIQQFKTSDFMVRFSDFKNQMETDARDFFARQNAYSVKDVRRVQMAYDKTGARFNQIMLEIKQDFMDKEKVKMINKFPDMYSNGLKGKIDGLEDFYKANFQQTLADVTEKDGSALLLVLVDLIKTAGELSQYFKNAKFEKQYMNDQYIQQNLVAPNRLPTWMELGSTTTLRTDVKTHPSRDGSSNNNNQNNGDNNNGGTNNGDNNNGNGDINNGNNGKRIPKPTEEMQNEKGEIQLDNANENNTEFGVEGKSTIKQPNNPKNIKQKPVPNRSNTEGVKKTIKQGN